MAVNVYTPAPRPSLALRLFLLLWPWSRPVSEPEAPAEPEEPDWLTLAEDGSCGEASIFVPGGEPIRVRVRPLRPVEMAQTGELHTELHLVLAPFVQAAVDIKDMDALAYADHIAKAAGEDQQDKLVAWVERASALAVRQVSHCWNPDADAWVPFEFVNEPSAAGVQPDGSVRYLMAAVCTASLSNILNAARRPLQEVAGAFGPFRREREGAADAG